MPSHPEPPTKRFSPRQHFLLAVLALSGLLLALFHKSFEPNLTLFSNDAPLAAMLAHYLALPAAFTGVWKDLNWIGERGIGIAPDFTTGLRWAIGTVWHSKVYVPVALLVLGLCAWFFFRRLKLRPTVCLLGALAATLNGNAFSSACWGLATWALALAAIFLALGALETAERRRPWLLTILAGLSVGWAVMEGYDLGAIFSLYAAAYAFFLCLEAPGPAGPKVMRGVARVAVMAVCAGLLAAQIITSLITTQVEGIAGAQQDQRTKQEQWDWATQWSLPKLETLRVIIPGLFGYRLDTPNGGNYWGTVGRDPHYDETHQGFPRHSGTGEYAGVLVVLVALWALAQSFRKTQPVFDPKEKRRIWFWSAATLISLGLAFGRHAPFYRLFYALPYASTIRNPIKFMHPFHLGLLVLFVLGLEGIARRYLAGRSTSAKGAIAELKQWWSREHGFDKKCAFGGLGLLAFSLVGWLVYASSHQELVAYLQQAMAGEVPTNVPSQIAGFSIREVGLYLLVLAFSVGLLIWIGSGALRGERARFAWLGLSVLLVLDLVRANEPWIIYQNYRRQNASNAIIDILRQDPHAYRVTAPPFQVPAQYGALQQVYRIQWMQYQFQCYNIQCLDIVQAPRTPIAYKDYNQALAHNPLRLWELTNTRYLLAPMPIVAQLNQMLGGGSSPFQTDCRFNFTQAANGDISVVTNTTGPFGLIDITNALPRLKFYSRWEVLTNDQALLTRLADPAFDPHRTVLIDTPFRQTMPAASTNAAPPQIKVTSYSPRNWALRTEAARAGVLLLNDGYDPDWQVRIDGQAAPLLRCNYLMRGVYLPAGAHTVKLHFAPPMKSVVVSLITLSVGLLLCGFVIWDRRRNPAL